jgi:hypothetical protein
MDVGMLCEQRPVKPVRFVILAIGIVVPTLCSPHFIAHEKHGHTNRKHRYGQKILHLPQLSWLTAVKDCCQVEPEAVDLLRGSSRGFHLHRQPARSSSRPSVGADRRKNWARRHNAAFAISSAGLEKHAQPLCAPGQVAQPVKIST